MDRTIIEKHVAYADDPEGLGGKWRVFRQMSEPFPFTSTHPPESVGYWNDLIDWDMRRAFRNGYPFYYFLHLDGKWRESLKSDEGWTGYFPTKEEAIVGLKAAGIEEYEDWSVIDWSQPETWLSSLKEKMEKKNECDGSEVA